MSTELAHAQFTRRPSRLVDFLQVLAFGAVYVAAAKLGFWAASQRVSPVWPPTGLAIWAVLYFGARVWPAIWIGTIVTNLTAHVPMFAAAGIATGNTLEALFAVSMLRRSGGIDRVVEGLRDVTALIITAALGATTISATIGVTMLCAAGNQPWTSFAPLWRIWWLGDATGALIVTPLLLTLPLWRRAPMDEKRLVEAVALELMAIAISILVFVFPLGPLTGRHPLEFAVFPLVIWAGLRFAHPGAALVSATVSVIAVWGTLRGSGPFGGQPAAAPESLILLQIFTAVIATSGLALGAAIADRTRSERLRAVDHTLTAILAEDQPLKAAAHRILAAVCDTLDWDVGIVWEARTDEQALRYVESWSRSPRIAAFVEDSRARRFEAGVGLPGRVWASAQPAWIHSLATDPNFPRAAAGARAGLHGGFAFPIRFGPNVLGVMEFFSRESRALDASLLALMAAAGSQIGQFIDRTRARRRAAEGEALNSAIVNAALDGVISIDAEGRILEFNPAASRTFGIAREEALGREMAGLLIPTRLRDRHRVALRRCAETGEGRILGERIEMPALHADGTEFPIELAITRVGAFEPPVFTAHLRDISERKRMENERSDLLARERSARLQAEQANRSKDQFLATVSHELRTPLTAILGWSSMLQTRQFEPERARQIFESVYRNAQAQAQIVNDLLDVSRIVTGQLRMDLHPIDLGDVARLGLETIRPTAVAKGVTLESDIPSTSCRVAGDPARLQQVIWNLLSNATKFTPAGGAIALTLRATGSRAILEVRDSGIGIPPAFLPHVFERFWQADSTTTRVYGGLGLGLALVRHIVELHGGEVRATSEGEGLGSTFTVTIPSLAANAAIREASPQMMGTIDVDLREITTLVVDDDPAARELFTAMLGEHGARVLCVESAPEAIQAFERHHPQVMLVDIGMPGEDGFALLRRIRAHEAANGMPPTPAIAVTAYAATIDRDDALAAGFAAHIPKPVLPQDLLAAVADAVNRGRRQPQI